MSQPSGRPRGFDAEEALERAMLVFWKQGYEGASLSDLTEAMGITKTSMYRAFGNKDELFLKALARYDQGPAAYGRRAAAEPTARAAAEAFLNGAVVTTTGIDTPAGCLGVQGALATSELGQAAHQALVAWRAEGRALMRQRFQRAVDEGDLPASADPDQLARYLLTVAYGIAVQAAGGLSREELQPIADTALLGWPFQPSSP
ncbi:TetR/AcrR family transcriptional regulator [Kineosporia babensis]|uniref:TetR/AcrR family transcriptional regulator n=1 Tax=Kineosporia babensis TaxID=499548 RepID=A0A9X1T2U8_9ACTN|nr:TetR/AcrR family transcriptional regulator [Kineosporia babensis]MCD5315043.1 TetR/AcrR family transcriptional regulator [Kineosporia babensis]